MLPRRVVKGIYGQALEFTGANHVDVPDSDSLEIATGEVSVTGHFAPGHGKP